ncbi:hypothetical protein [Thioflexithrix psekupsensis]|uniref:Uncharacterized protein n=1 Tax=Thioflexithrix psekupsensis TaxID=1570016 RepID=A0A251X881_9GAMM|nr:hypothetical protein [Thioflexithrix psekupsensis]OUD14206.1 hypothetical protein TPSD3_07700 [Thioflexithrix psekupsensis]
MIEFTTSSLTLYAYQLASDTDTDQRADAQQLWDNLTAVCQNVLHLPELAQFKRHFISEKGQDTRFLSLFGGENPSKAEQNEHWRARIVPVRLHDVYAVDFTLSPVNNPLSLAQLHQLNPKGCLLPQTINANLGQTLLLYLQPTTAISIDEPFIRQCIAQLWQDSGETSPEFVVKHGRLFGSSFYDCVSVSQAQNVIPIHLIVFIGEENHAKTLELAQKHNLILMKLLASRHKVEYVTRNAQINYNEARELDKLLKEKNKIFAQLPHSKTDKVDQLEQLLQELPNDAKQFGDHLRALNDHQFTLTANLKNYHDLLTQFQTLTADNDLHAWQNFYHYAKDITALQLDLFKGYLSPTQPLFQELTQNIQGLLQIQTLKHEFDKQERLERLVVVIASTLESAAISVKVDYHHHFAQDLFGHYYSNISGIFGEHLTGIFAHLGVGLGFGLLAFGILFLYQKTKKH